MRAMFELSRSRWFVTKHKQIVQRVLPLKSMRTIVIVSSTAIHKPSQDKNQQPLATLLIRSEDRPHVRLQPDYD